MKDVAGHRTEFLGQTAALRPQRLAAALVKRGGVAVQQVKIVCRACRNLALQEGHGKGLGFGLGAAAKAAVRAIGILQHAVLKGKWPGLSKTATPQIVIKIGRAHV